VSASLPRLAAKILPSCRFADAPLAAGSGRRLYEFREAADTAAGSPTFLLFSKRKCGILPVGNQNGGTMKQKTDVLQGTLALMVLKTLDVLGPLHGYGVARRIEQISGDLLAVNQGTLYPVLLKLEQEGAIASEWGASENNRRARFYRLTREGRKQLQVETQDWEQTAAIIGRFFEAKAEDLS
jgi:transcriptional regulator